MIRPTSVRLFTITLGLLAIFAGLFFCPHGSAQTITEGSGSTTTAASTEIAGPGQTSMIYSNGGNADPDNFSNGGGGGGTYRVGSSASPTSPLNGPGSFTIDGNLQIGVGGVQLSIDSYTAGTTLGTPNEGRLIFYDGSNLNITYAGTSGVSEALIVNGPTTYNNAGTYGTAPGLIDLNGGTTNINLEGGTHETILSISTQIADGNLNLTNTGSNLGLVQLTTAGNIPYVNTYGTTTVGSGVTFQVGNAGAGTSGTGAVTVLSGGTLVGSGTVQGTAGVTNHVIQSGGLLSPGDQFGYSLGTLGVVGNLNLNSGSTVNLQVNNTSPSQSTLTFDKIAINGTLTLNSGTIINVLDSANSISSFSAGTFAANAFNGEDIDLFSFTSLTNDGFNVGTNFRTGGAGGGNLNLPTLSGGLVYDLRSFLVNGTIIISTPEPSRMILMTCGLAGMLLRRRR